MTSPKLGRMEKIELRDVWKTEAGDFTPWLAGEENLALLGDTIGLELELEAQEKEVGPFRADILCRDTVDGHWVLIENQLEKTDHIHLGQLLTYAAGLKAVTIVWIADRFTEEHRAALDWLNDITDDSFNFFGLEVELWKIGDSIAAPKFNLTSKPNEWSRTITGAAHRAEAGAVTETRQLQQEYWFALREELLNRKSFLSLRQPLPQNWQTFALGKTYFTLAAAMNTQKQFIQVIVECWGDNAKAEFHLLRKEQDAIEKEVGSKLEWREMPDKKQSRIILQKNGVNPIDKNDWVEQHAWLTDTLEKFHKAFSPRIKKLDASNYDPDENDSED